MEETLRSLVAESRERIQVLAGTITSTLELACAGVVCEPEITVKVRLGRQAWLMAQCADTLMRRLPELKTARDQVERSLPMPQHWPAEENINDAVAASLRNVYGRLEEAVRQTVPLPDEPTLATLRSGLSFLTEARELAAPALPGTGDGPAWPLDCLDFGEERPAALESIPERPARSLDLAQSANYVGPPLAKDMSNRTVFLHAVALGVELCAAEACAAMVASNPRAPWGLRYDLARQLNDEVRHFRLFESRIRELGGFIGQYPVEYDVWDRFRLGTDISEQLMIEQRIGESVGLDGGALAYAGFRAAGDNKTASIFDFINADEVTHVSLGNRWLKKLLPSELQRADLEQKLRQRLADSELSVKAGLPVNSPDRLLAGYSEQELLSVRSASSS